MIKSTATIVLVHGAWADGSSWNRVIPVLLAKDFAVIAVQIPLSSVADDLAATNRILADTQGPIPCRSQLGRHGHHSGRD
jgi:pimeloyl-ACP methyl ester carboxylesterase